MLNVFSARAGVELTRMRAEQQLGESLERNENNVRTLRALTARPDGAPAIRP